MEVGGVGGTVRLSRKMEALYAGSNKRAEAATGSYSAAGDFLHSFYSVLVAKVFPSWVFLHIYFLTILIISKEQLYWRKIIRGCFRFIMLWLLIMNRCADWCALQLYRTSLKELIHHSGIMQIWFEEYFLALTEHKDLQTHTSWSHKNCHGDINKTFCWFHFTSFITVKLQRFHQCIINWRPL